MKREQKKTATFLVTVPLELEKAIQKEAEKERRSRHAQVVRALEERYLPIAQETLKQAA